MARILLAEDDDSLRVFLERALTRAGHIVSAHGQGDTALAELRRRPIGYDVLVTDIMMPGLDGIALAKEAATVDADLKVLFITGFAAVALNSANALAAPENVLSKPFHLRDLVRAIDAVLVSPNAA